VFKKAHLQKKHYKGVFYKTKSLSLQVNYQAHFLCRTMARKHFLSFDENSEELLKKYEDFAAGISPAGYFDVEEFESIINHYLFLGSIEKAATALEIGLKQHPASSDLQIKRAKILLLDNQAEQAYQILQSLTEQGDYESTILKIDALLKLNRNDEASAVVENFFATNESELLLELAFLDLALLYMHYEKWNTALKLLEKGRSKNPRNIDILFELTTCYEQLLDFDKAIENQKYILEINPFLSEAWFNLGQLYFSQHNYTQALDAFDYSLAINPKDMQACLQKAHVLLNLERFDEAVEHYMEFIENADTPLKGLIYGYIGECYEYLEKNEKAIYWYQKSLELEPESCDSLVGLGICMLEQERFEEGLIYLQKAIEIDPEFAETYVYLAEAYIGMDDIDSALSAYKKSLEFEPNQAETLVAVGTLLLEKDEFRTALDYYESAYKLNPDLEQINLFLAIVHFKLNNFDIAMEYLLEAVTIDHQALSDFLEICPEAAERLEKSSQSEENVLKRSAAG